jgi:hypothetical protein
MLYEGLEVINRSTGIESYEVRPGRVSQPQEIIRNLIESIAFDFHEPGEEDTMQQLAGVYVGNCCSGWPWRARTVSTDRNIKDKAPASDFSWACARPISVSAQVLNYI